MSILDVYFNGKHIKDKEVVPLEQVQINKEPHVKFQPPANKYYTTIMFDPDAPSRESHINRNHLHWLKVNNTSAIVPFEPSNPPAGSGPHRYCICLLEQQGPITVPEFENTKPKRAKFNVDQFVKKYKLKPVSTIMYVTERPK